MDKLRDRVFLNRRERTARPEGAPELIWSKMLCKTDPGTDLRSASCVGREQSLR